MNRFFAHLLASALALSPLPLQAFEPPPTPKEAPTKEDLERAKELFENGKELYLGGSYDASIAAFKEAYELSGDPILLYNIFQAYDRANAYDEAIEYIEYYRAFAPASERDELSQKVESLRRRKLRDEAEGDGTSDEMTPDDRSTTPATSDDSSPERERSPGDTEEPPPADVRVFSPLVIAFSAVAVVGLGAGIGLGIASRQRNDDAQRFCGGSPLVCSGQAQDDLEGARSMAIGADVGFAVAGAAAIGAVVAIVVNASRRKKSRSAANTAKRVDVGPIASGVRVRF